MLFQNEVVVTLAFLQYRCFVTSPYISEDLLFTLLSKNEKGSEND